MIRADTVVSAKQTIKYASFSVAQYGEIIKAEKWKASVYWGSCQFIVVHKPRKFFFSLSVSLCSL